MTLPFGDGLSLESSSSAAATVSRSSMEEGCRRRAPPSRKDYEHPLDAKLAGRGRAEGLL
jgi:hypothetical protein